MTSAAPHLARPRLPVAARPIGAAVVALMTAVTALSNATATAASPDPTIAAARADLDESTAAVADAATALRSSEDALNRARAAKEAADLTVELAHMRYDAAALVVGRSQTLLSLMQQASEGARSDLVAAQVAAGETARTAYVRGPLSDVAELFTSGDLTALQDRRIALASVGRAQVNRTAALTAIADDYGHQATDMARQRDALGAQQRAVAETLDSLDEAQRHADGTTAALAAAVDAHIVALASAEGAAAEDERRYQELVSEGTTGLTGTSHLPRLTPVVSAADAHLLAPAQGPITSPFGMRKHPITGVYKLHTGTDFGVPCGTPVVAAAAGTVLSTTLNPAYGNRLVLTHPALGLLTTYNHLTSFLVPAGATVARGDVIAVSGTTGYSTGCHLHFEVVVDGSYVDPMPWLSP